MPSCAHERVPVQSRGYPVRDQPNSPTELARIVAARQRWKIGHLVGDLFDSTGELVADSIEQFARACAGLGVFAGDEIAGYTGVHWSRVDPQFAGAVRRYLTGEVTAR
ncbi:hypothetical protein [Cumulibacter manganitolerans]|uniref:hypothetical protein n=1 Tax=Cumulibacter manganitolerans TaxID=1884992 RepID=UPI00129499D0|nr:hypothetical protein [Cumulibacter manganitolerans]